jgi:hypothetical protein
VGASVYPGVLLRCYAGVMQTASGPSRESGHRGRYAGSVRARRLVRRHSPDALQRMGTAAARRHVGQAAAPNPEAGDRRSNLRTGTLVADIDWLFPFEEVPFIIGRPLNWEFAVGAEELEPPTFAL